MFQGASFRCINVFRLFLTRYGPHEIWLLFYIRWEIIRPTFSDIWRDNEVQRDGPHASMGRCIQWMRRWHDSACTRRSSTRHVALLMSKWTWMILWGARRPAAVRQVVTFCAWAPPPNYREAVFVRACARVCARARVRVCQEDPGHEGVLCLENWKRKKKHYLRN